MCSHVYSVYLVSVRTCAVAMMAPLVVMAPLVEAHGWELFRALDVAMRETTRADAQAVYSTGVHINIPII